jgi:integrase
MAVTKRKGALYIYFNPFREKGKLIGLKVDVATVTEAKQLEAVLLRACRSGNYGSLDPAARVHCSRLFENQGWEMPPELEVGTRSKPQETLTLAKAAQLFLKYPGVRDQKNPWRYEAAIVNLLTYFGKDVAIKSLWVPHLRQYQVERTNEGSAAATVNRELGTLSRVFGVLIEMQLVENNPVRLIKRLSEKAGQRQAYLSLDSIEAIAARCPEWYQPILWTGSYTGMRRGEILELTRKRLNLSRRMIYLGPDDVKEGKWKRVPIHRDLVPILRTVLNGPPLISGRVFPLRDEKGVRDLGLETFKNCWPRACEALELEIPWPRFHDLRHTWRANARRSGMDASIAESILGHWNRGRPVNQRYGRISDEELIAAVDAMTFNHGETEILAAGR